jgi:hypothetical protein
MSAVMPTEGATHDPNPPTDARRLTEARKGYAEMVKLLSRHRGTHGGMRLGSPQDVLLGLHLQDAVPLFIDPFQMSRLRTLLVVGAEGSGKQFTADLLRLRASWTYPRDHLRVVDATAAAWTDERRAAMVGSGRPDEANLGRFGWRFPEGPRKAKDPREAMVLLGDNTGPTGVHGHDSKDPLARGEFPGEAVLFLNGGEGPERVMSGGYPLFTDAEHEWLPRARMPKEAGYAEGLLVFGIWKWHIPIAVVASTPEYEYLTGEVVP